MKYKNTKTGVIINSPCKVSGGDWVEINSQTIEELAEDEKKETEDYVEEEINLEEMTNRQLEEFAKEHDIELTTDDKKNKNTRIAAIAKAFE